MSHDAGVGVREEHLKNTNSLANITNFLENKLTRFVPNVVRITETLQKDVADYVEYYDDSSDTVISVNTPITLGSKVFYEKTQERKATGIRNVGQLLRATLAEVFSIKGSEELYRELTSEFFVDGIGTEVFSFKFTNNSLFEEHLQEAKDKLLPAEVAILKRINNANKTVFYAKSKRYSIDLFDITGPSNPTDKSVILIEELLSKLSKSLHLAEVTAYAFVPYFSLSPVILTEDVPSAKYAFQLLEGNGYFDKLPARTPFINKRNIIILETSIPISLNIEVRTPNSNVTNIVSLYIGQTFFGNVLIGKQYVSKFYEKVEFDNVHSILDAETNGVLDNTYADTSVYTELSSTDSVLTSIEASKRFSKYSSELYGILTSKPLI